MHGAKTTPNVKQSYFENKYGQKIDFLPGYFELFQDVTKKYPGISQQVHDRADYLKSRGLHNPNGANVRYASFLSRHARVAKMIEMFDRLGVTRPFHSNLDIGTGHAITPRLVKAFGVTKEAYGLDIVDRSYYITAKEILEYERYMRRRRTLVPVIEKLFPDDGSLLEDRMNTPYGEFGAYVTKEAFYPRIKRKDIDLDGPIIEDVFNYNDKHDLITAFVCLEYFDAESIIQRVSDILVEGGIFFVYVNLWWYIINSTQLVGHFPYAANRLETDDWERYCKTFHPALSEHMIKIYDYFDPTHPTVSQYIEIASRHGLVLRGYERCIHDQPHDPRSRLSPNYLESFFKNSYLSGVLSNISKFRSDVTIEDLQTSHVQIVFQKKPYRGPLEIDENMRRGAKASKPKISSLRRWRRSLGRGRSES